MNTQKTFDKQTAQFIAVIAQNLPTMSGDVMQGWIQNPLAVQRTLRPFAPPESGGSDETNSAANLVRCDADIEGMSLLKLIV